LLDRFIYWWIDLLVIMIMVVGVPLKVIIMTVVPLLLIMMVIMVPNTLVAVLVWVV
jgi:hypothetical protein